MDMTTRKARDLLMQLRRKLEAKHRREVAAIECLLGSTGDDDAAEGDDTTYVERIRAALEKQEAGAAFSSREIARMTGIEREAVRTALNKAKPNPFEKVKVGDRRIKWRITKKVAS